MRHEKSVKQQAGRGRGTRAGSISNNRSLSMKNVMTSLKSIRWIIVAFACVQFTAFQALAYYNPQTGRWLSRDPLGEPGFQVLQAANASPRVGNPVPLPPGRFISRDSIGEIGFETLRAGRGRRIHAEDENLYRFVGNDPVRRIDPLGLFVSANPDDAVAVGNAFADVFADTGGVIDANFGAVVGGGVTVMYCCDQNKSRVKATFVKYCIGLYFGTSATVGYQKGVSGSNCPKGYSGWFIEAGGGFGPLAGGGNVSPNGSVGGPGVGIGLGGGAWMCNYALLHSEIVGCCK